MGGRTANFSRGGESGLQTESLRGSAPYGQLPLMKLSGKVAVVTGAGRGIGEAIALRLASEGASIAVVSRTEANSAKVAADITAAHGVPVKAYAVDVADFDAVHTVAAQILAEFGSVEILVNNAGITRDTLSMRMTSDDWDSVLSTNLKGAFNWIHALQRPMAKQRSGRIINISSVSGLIGTAGQANYAASKAGLIGLTKTVARELAGRGVTVNAIAPGFIETDMTSALPEEIRGKYIAQIPLARFGRTEDIASAVGFLASPEASYITGQTLVVDGGLVMS